MKPEKLSLRAAKHALGQSYAVLKATLTQKLHNNSNQYLMAALCMPKGD